MVLMGIMGEVSFILEINEDRRDIVFCESSERFMKR